MKWIFAWLWILFFIGVGLLAGIQIGKHIPCSEVEQFDIKPLEK